MRYAAALLALLAGCSTPSLWPSVEKACRAHGGPKSADGLPSGSMLITCADGATAVVK